MAACWPSLGRPTPIWTVGAVFVMVAAGCSTMVDREADGGGAERRSAGAGGVGTVPRRRRRCRADPGRAQCGKITVPIDYSKPDGAVANLALIRFPATDQKIGSLVINPGDGRVSARRGRAQLRQQPAHRTGADDAREEGRPTTRSALTGPTRDRRVRGWTAPSSQPRIGKRRLAASSSSPVCITRRTCASISSTSGCSPNARRCRSAAAPG